MLTSMLGYHDLFTLLVQVAVADFNPIHLSSGSVPFLECQDGSTV